MLYPCLILFLIFSDLNFMACKARFFITKFLEVTISDFFLFFLFFSDGDNFFSKKTYQTKKEKSKCKKSILSKVFEI